MSFVVVNDGTDRESWLRDRRHGVTATDVARLARGGAGTWAAIRAEKEGRGRDFRNQAMQHGIDREPFIAAYAQSEFGLVPSKALIAAADNLLYLATPDGIGGDEVGEYKTTVHDWNVLADAPGRYVDQNLWQQRVSGIRRGRLVFEPHENGVPLYPFPKDFTVDWDADRVAELEAAADEFLAGKGEPDEDAAELDSMLSVYVDLSDIADAAAARADAVRIAIEERLGGKPIKFEGSLANLTRSPDGTRAQFSSTALKAADPDIYQRYVTEAPVKGRLTITRRAA